jgi:hypothetical protein
MPSPSPAADAATTNDLLAAIRDHLDVPDTTDEHYDKRARLRSDRGIVVSAVLELHLDGRLTVADAIETLTTCAASTVAVNYPIVGDCGPACNAPVDGVHDSCPGPHADATVEAD